MMATKRRKGEKPVLHQPIVWAEDCVIAKCIKQGDRWLYAWIMQQCVPMEKLSRRSGLSLDRLDALWRGEHASDEDLEALAEPFRTDPATLRASVDYAARMNGAAAHGL